MNKKSGKNREPESRGAGESGSRRVGEPESGGNGEMSLRGMPKASEAIPFGIASTIIPANDNDHDRIRGSVLLEAIH